MPTWNAIPRGNSILESNATGCFEVEDHSMLASIIGSVTEQNDFLVTGALAVIFATPEAGHVDLEEPMPPRRQNFHAILPHQVDPRSSGRR